MHSFSFSFNTLFLLSHSMPRHSERHSFSNQQSIKSTVTSRLYWQCGINDRAIASSACWLNSWGEWKHDEYGDGELHSHLTRLLISPLSHWIQRLSSHIYVDIFYQIQIKKQTHNYGCALLNDKFILTAYTQVSKSVYLHCIAIVWIIQELLYCSVQIA